MAPTSKSTSTSASKGTLTGNPAPDFAMTMNRIQTQLEARMKAARAFLPSRSDLNNNNNSSSTGSFSALSSNSSNPQSRDAAAAAAIAARRAAEEAEFAEERGLDPNAGIGLIRSSAAKDDNASGVDRETARLRGRLLGKRGRGGADKDGGGQQQQQRWARKEDSSSSDEEAGRSGLGRAKRRNGNGNGNGKRTREDMEMETQGDLGSDRLGHQVATGTTTAPGPKEAQARTDGPEAQVNPDNDPEGGGTETLVAEHTEATELPLGSNQPLSSENPKKKRKKKKKKSRDRTGGEHVG
ncbi:uncharacterized protein F4812DRAFT_413826 [Daldinia caldariorum]|uniref:uncharacterized protein n=1 Tax=Daldinia caldariorum TaxID=326644 RepID=UPI002007BFC6|nr:uncharacterized protein F4812DRAFT_413826 [Daldinia caldariorum]KAI1471380.1 hypothetical protein F4812DRAFT_413826 [Daldinia caldariorum]